MSSARTVIRRTSTLLSCVPLFLTGPLQGQGGSGTVAQREMARRVPVTISLVDSLPGSEPVVVERRASGSRNDVVLVRPGATGDQLAAALVALNAHRDVAGDTVTTSARLKTTTAVPVRLQSTEVAHARDILRRLRTTSPTLVSGVGRVPSITVYLPSKAQRDQARRSPPHH